MNEKVKISFPDIKAVGLKGVKVDKIISWTVSSDGKATVAYLVNGKERLISLESEAIEIELGTDV